MATSGDAGYRIPFGRLNNVTFSVDFDGAGSPNFEVVEDSGAYEVRLDGALTAGGAGVRALTLTATASCAPGGDRICSDPATLTLTLTFKRRANPTFYASIMEGFNSNNNFEVAVSIPDEYSIHSTPGILDRTVSVIGRLDYPLPLTGAVAGTAESCLALGGRVVTDGAAQICVDYTFSNSEERTATGGGCVISGGPSGELECSEAFEQVRDCNTGGVRRPAMNNSACSATSQGICPGGYALGGGCPIVGALTFRESDDMLVYAAGDEISAPGAGVYTVTIALTHPSLLGRLIAGAIVSITKKDAPGSFGLDGGTSATRRIAHGYTGEVYRTSAAGGVITLPATLPSDIYSATGGRELVISLTQALPLRGSSTHMFTLTVKYSNVNRAKNYNSKEQVLALLVESLGNPIPQIRPVSSNEHPAGSHVYDFSTDYEGGAYADATFSEIGDSPHFEVSAGGVVETQAALAPGEYAITIEAQDPRGTSEAFIGAATLTLSLTIVADGGASEFSNDPESIVRVAVGHTGAIYTLTANHSYTLANHVFTNRPDLEFDANSGVFSIPSNNSLGGTARRMTVGVDAICPASGMNSAGVEGFCEPGGAAANLTVTLIAVPVSAANVNATPAYGSDEFNEEVALPWIPTETVFGGGGHPRYTLDNVSVTLSEGGAGFVYADGRVKFDTDALPEPGSYTLTFDITHKNSDGRVGFAGTVRSMMSVGVGRADSIIGVRETERLDVSADVNGNPIVIVAAFGDLVTPLYTMTLSDTALSAEFAEPPALPAASAYSVSRSSDKRALIVHRATAETAATLARTGSRDDTRHAVDAMFTVTAAGADGARYEPKIQRFAIEALQFAEPVFVSIYQGFNTFPATDELVDLADVKIVPSIDSFRTYYSTYRDYISVLVDTDHDSDPTTPDERTLERRGGLVFGKESGDAAFSVTDDGKVSVSEISAVGGYSAVITATAEAFTGVARFTVSVEVRAAGAVNFAGIPVEAGTIRLTNLAERKDPVVNGADRGVRVTTLAAADMVYGGVSRGLHWMVGATDLKSDAEWYGKPICDAGSKGADSSGWRLPTLIEMAGGVLPVTATAKTAIAARINGFGGSATDDALEVFEITGLLNELRVDFLTMTVNGRGSKDNAPLASSYTVGYFAEVFHAAAESSSGTRGYPAHVSYHDNEVRIAQRNSGRVVCVREDSSASYVKPPVWAELAVEDGNADHLGANQAAVELTAFAEVVTANLTVKLGLFNERGRETPNPVVTLTKADLTVTRLDNLTREFEIDHMIVEDKGGAVLIVSAPEGGGASGLGSGDYVLEVAFAPAGNKYFGFAQRDFMRPRISTNETQFYPVKVTVSWDAPRDTANAFVFGSVTIAGVGDRATVDAKDWGLGEPNDQGGTNLNIAVGMEYLGVRGNLDVMYEHGGAANQYVNYGTSLCEAGGADWRRPKLTEIAMLLTPTSVTMLSVNLALSDSVPGRASTSGNLVLTFPALETGKTPLLDGIDTDVAAIYSGLYSNQNGGYSTDSQVFSYNTSNGSAGFGTGQTAASWVCVREKDGYDASKHKQLVGVAFSDADEGVEAGDTIGADASVPTTLTAPSRAAYTLTVLAWTFGNFELDGGSFAGENFKLNIEEDEDLVPDMTSALVYPDNDNSDYDIEATDVGGKPGIVRLVITPKVGGSNTNLDVKIEFTPPLGDTVTLTVNFP